MIIRLYSQRNNLAAATANASRIAIPEVEHIEKFSLAPHSFRKGAEHEATSSTTICCPSGAHKNTDCLAIPRSWTI